MIDTFTTTVLTLNSNPVNSGVFLGGKKQPGPVCAGVRDFFFL